MAEKAGRPRVLVRRHVLEIKEDTQDWIEDTIAQFTEQRSIGRNSRIIGAAIAAAGVYAMVRLINEFGREIGKAVTNLTTDIFTGVSVPVINVFLSIFTQRSHVTDPVITVKPGEEEKGTELPPGIDILRDMGRPDPFAFGAALTAGGMVLAGLNPREILKGIGSIIDALIPL